MQPSSFTLRGSPPAAAESKSQPTVHGRSAPRFLPLILVLIAVIYYGSYLRCWFNPHDEGGTAVLLATRLLHGERPFVDVEIGYNVGWFYPLVGIFKIFGPHYLFTRAWFFLLSTAAAVVAFRLVRLTTGSPWFAFAIGLFFVVYPGSQFKNYIPLLAVLNSCVIVQTMRRQDRSLRTLAIDALWGGFALGVTFLIRIELGWLFTLLWLGAFAWLWLDTRLTFGGKALRTLLFLLIVSSTIVALHLPVYLDARSRGFDRPFLAKYALWQDTFLATRAREAAGVAATDPQSTKKKSKRPIVVANRSTLPRTPLTDMLKGSDLQQRALAFLTYAPLVGYAVFFLWIGAKLFRSVGQRNFATNNGAYLALLALIGSLAVFPQFFFFRPDRPHLSEFMPLYMAAAAISLWIMWREAKGIPAGATLAVATIFVVFQITIFGWFAMQHPSAGTIAARTKRTIPFRGENGVQVLVQKKEFEFLENIRKTVASYSKPGDFLICYPYQPGFNVMTDRPTYLQNVYIDNATQPAGWARTTIAELEQYKPAMIIIDDRAINKLEDSRFSRWAAPVHEYVRGHYQLRGVFLAGVEVYSAGASSPAP